MKNLPQTAFAACVLTIFAACSSSSSDEGPGASPTGPASSGTGAGAGAISPAAGAAVGTCENSQLTINFNPMYSAYDGVNLYQVPAAIEGIDPSTVEWSLSDPSIANLEAVAEGVMLTIQAPGQATLTASAGGGALCGTAELYVSDVSPEMWEIGNARYNEGLELTFEPGPGGAPPAIPDEPVEAACTNCHGESATDGIFSTVSHTPTQTAGFSDEELVRIFTEGVHPEGASFNDAIVPQPIWERFHRWAMTDEQKLAMVVYLRSLSPAEQTGRLSFPPRPPSNPGAGGSATTGAMDGAGTAGSSMAGSGKAGASMGGAASTL